MLPVLARIPLPHWVVPLSLPLILLAGAFTLLAIFAKLADLRPQMWRGLVAAAGFGLFGWVLRGRTFALGDIPLHSYGTLLALVLVGGWWSCRRLADREGLTHELMAHCYVVSVFGGLFGARFFYVLTHPHEFRSAFSALSLWGGGLSGYGGLLGGTATLFALCKGLGLKWWSWADFTAPRIAAGLAVVRVGSYLYGNDYGRLLGDSAPNWLKHLGTFPRWPSESELGAGSPAWLDQAQYAGLSANATASLPVHPTQLYEATLAAALFGLALWLAHRRRFNGEIFLMLALIYGVGSYLLELTRADYGSVGSGWAFQFLSLPQIINFTVFLWALINWRRLRSQLLTGTTR